MRTVLLEKRVAKLHAALGHEMVQHDAAGRKERARKIYEILKEDERLARMEMTAVLLEERQANER